MTGVAIVLILLYFVPGIVGGIRNHRQKLAIIVLNLLLGWTVLGWVIALVWALTNERRVP